MLPSGTPTLPQEVLKIIACGCTANESCAKGLCSCLGVQLACATFCKCYKKYHNLWIPKEDVLLEEYTEELDDNVEEN